MNIWETKRFLHKPTEVFATSFVDRDGRIDLAGFPILVTAIRTDRFFTDGILGPLPMFKVSWTDAHGYQESEVPHNIVFVARACYNNPSSFYLTFVVYDQFFREYDSK